MKRLGQTVLTLVIASVAIWMLDALSPIDPAEEVLASRGIPSASDAQIATVRRELGLNRPQWDQYLRWLGNGLRGNFGTSWISGEPVRTEIGSRLGPTLLLAGVAISIVIAASIVGGCVAALLAWRWPDTTIRAGTVVAAAVPSFVLAIFLVQFVVIRFRVGEAVTNGTAGEVLLPAICVAANSVAVPTRVLRSSMVTAMQSTYARVARARGATPARIIARHALPNALVPYVNALALSAPWMVGGTVVVERIFSWPGVGSYLVQSVEQRDIPVVQAIVLLTTVAYLIASLLADLVAWALR
jgi:ABC-type dipeptide/oligopeptide/nickel transport system permease component